jgi:hypothetical protein
MALKLVSSMEQEDLSVVDTGMDAAPAADSVETDMLNLTAEEGEISALDEGIEVAGDDMEQLEQVRDNLEGSLDNGGASPETVEMAAVTVEAISRRQGIKIGHVAKESFSNSKTRIANTKLAIEGIGDTVKRIWDSIVKAIKKMWEKVKKWWNSYFDGVTKMEERWKKLTARAERVTGDENKKDNDKKETFESTSLVKAIGDMAPAANKPLDENEFIKTNAFWFAGGGNNLNSDELLTVTSGILTTWMNGISDMDSFRKAKLPNFKAINGFALDNKRTDASKNDDQIALYGPKFFGNKQVALVVPEDGELGKEVFKAWDAKIEIVDAIVSGHEFDGEKITPMTMKRVKEFCKQGTVDIKQIKEARKTLDKLTASVDKFTGTLAKFAKGTEDDSDKDDIKLAQSSAKSASSFATKIGSTVLNLILNQHKILADYVELSIGRKTSGGTAAATATPPTP